MIFMRLSINFEANKIKDIVRRGKQILREEGFLPLLKRLFTYKTVYIYENTLHGPSIACKVNNLALKIITCSEELVRLLSEGFDFSLYPMSIQQCKERLNRGAILFCAFISKELAHGSWVAMNRRAYRDFYSFTINRRHTACIGGTITVPKYQRKGINVYVHSEIFRYLRKKGASKAMLEIHNDNIAAQNSQRKLGSYVWGEGHHLRLFYLLNFRWVTPIRGFTHCCEV